MTGIIVRKPITQAMQLAVYREHAMTVCGRCRRMGYRFDIDHHLALVDGGAHDVSNLHFMCEDCHADKSAREHKNNAKAKRLAAAREAHERGEKKASRMKSRGFPKDLSKKFDGRVVPGKPATFTSSNE